MGPADVLPAYSPTDGGVVVVRAEETSAHGEAPQELSRRRTLEDDMLTEPCQIVVQPYHDPVLHLQTRLARKAESEPTHRFGNLYDLLTWEPLLDAAATRLLGNKGSRTPGLDGAHRRELQPDRRASHMHRLRQQLKDGTFQPLPVKRIYIPKKNGKLRPLGIPTIYDRWIQMAIKLILEPIFESDFTSFSHGFRPNRSCHTALAHIQSAARIRKRKYYWVIEGDIEGCFDHVHHKKLMSLLRKRIRDRRLLDLIWQYLRAGFMEEGLFKKTEAGTPQGGVLSPLLANIYLNHFDQWFAERAMLGDKYQREKNRKAGHANFLMVRYADDFVILSNGTKADTAAFKEEMKAWLKRELHLTLSDEKTTITHFRDGFNFLGFTVKKTEARNETREVVVHYPSTASVQRAIRRIAELTDRRHVSKSREDTLTALNTFLRGWGEYFRHASAKRALSYIGSYAHMRMWSWLLVKEKGSTRRGWREIRAKYYHNGTWHVGKYTLFVPATMKIEYPRHRIYSNPYLLASPVKEPEHHDPHQMTWGGYRALYGPEWEPIRNAILRKYDDTCALCGSTDDVEVHHIKARKQGGSHAETNLVPLCRQHHRQAKRRNGPVSHQLRKILLNSGEPDAVKVARPVRGEGL